MRVKRKSETGGLSRLARIVLLPILVVAALVVLILAFSNNDNTDISKMLLLQQNAVPCPEPDETNTIIKYVSDESSALPPMTDSTSATVMGFAVGYDVSVYKRFVGSLRKTGYKGHIILAVRDDISKQAEEYCKSKNVVTPKVEFVNCTHGMFDDDDKDESKVAGHEKEKRSCVKPYDKLKSRWGRFPFLRDRLKECKTCTGPVLITDVRDTFFQRDPFGSGHPQVEGLQVFEEHKKQRTTHWLAQWPIKTCKGIEFDEVMLCSGTTIGTREAMIDYLDAMEAEMMVWMADKNCHFKTINGDDQSIHNYLYYSGKLPFAKAIPNRMGIVNTPGVQGAIIFKAHQRRMKEQGKEPALPFDGLDPAKKSWLPQEYDLTDEDGFFTDFDGNRSAVVHQYERLGPQPDKWLSKMGLIDV